MHFDTIVFSGGGNRCFWQAGFWSVVGASLQLQPARVTAVSAGAAMACVLFAGTFESGFEDHKRAVLRNPYNLYVRNLLKAKPVFPHGAMYRAAILGSINVSALARLHQGPEITIVVARPPAWASRRLALVLGAVSAGVDAWNSRKLEAAAARRLGFRPVHVSVRDCRTPEELADLIVASSCVPPLTPLMHADGIPLFDGGLVGAVPTDPAAKAQGRTLVLLTRRFEQLLPQPGTIYVQPSRPVPVGTWDYTDHEALQAAYDLGQSDGAEFFATFRAAAAHQQTVPGAA